VNSRVIVADQIEEDKLRLQSEIQITVKGKIIGGPLPLVCLPLVATDKADLLKQADQLKQLNPDLLEWRIDGYQAVEDVAVCLADLQALKAAVNSIPLIFTCRIDKEGGFQFIAQDARLKLMIAAIQSGAVDLIDIELCNEPGFIDAVKQHTVPNDVKLILSYHNFDDTPEARFIHDKLVMAQQMGADVAKVAVMPKNYEDVLTLMAATLKARTGKVKTPIVTMAMGPEGGITRVAGGLFGSDITFAVGQKTSAPGQIPIAKLRQAMNVVYE
jgi:3-dehydroquinate dehydratase-1